MSRSVWILVSVLFLLVSSVAFALLARSQMPPRILKLVPNPVETPELIPDVQGEAVFSVPMDTLTVEYGIRFTEITDSGKKGPFLLKDYVDFEWSDHDRRVTFRIKPQYRPAVGSVFFVEVAGLRGKNRKLLQPASFSATFRIVDLMSKSHWTQEDLRRMLRMLREGDY